MKKLVLGIMILGLMGSAYAASKWVPTTFSGDQLIQSGRTIITDGNIYYSGVTAGNKLELKNGTTSSGTVIYTFIAPAANGSQQLPQYTKDFIVDTGLYMDATISGGAMGLELFYQ
jgi:hypothetical protein